MLLGTYQIMFRYLLFSCCCTIFLPARPFLSVCTEPKRSVDSKSMMGCFFFINENKHFIMSNISLVRFRYGVWIRLTSERRTKTTTTTIWNDVYFLSSSTESPASVCGSIGKIKRDSSVVSNTREEQISSDRQAAVNPIPTRRDDD